MEAEKPRQKNKTPYEKELEAIAKANARWLKSTPSKNNVQKRNPPPIWWNKK
jgi:hypothetical protein